MPKNYPDDIRRLLQALLIVHAEPKLNITINHTGPTLQSEVSNECWCQHLVHPRFSLPLISEMYN